MADGRQVMFVYVRLLHVHRGARACVRACTCMCASECVCMCMCTPACVCPATNATNAGACWNTEQPSLTYHPSARLSTSSTAHSRAHKEGMELSKEGGTPNWHSCTIVCSRRSGGRRKPSHASAGVVEASAWRGGIASRMGGLVRNGSAQVPLWLSAYHYNTNWHSSRLGTAHVRG